MTIFEGDAKHLNPNPSWCMCFRGFDVAIVSTIIRLNCGIILYFVNYIGISPFLNPNIDLHA